MSDDASTDNDDYLVSHPHDAFFKDFFSDPAHATTFFQTHLPAEIAGLVQWDSLALVPGSFIKRSLQQAHSDLLFSARLESEDSTRECLLYLLFEHQTSADPAMPLRLLAYQVEILLGHLHKNGLPLPPVVCYVLNQGPDRWTVSQRFEDLFQLPEADAAILLEYLPKFQHVLLDLTQLDPGKTEDDPTLQVALQLMKLVRRKEVMEFFQWLVVHIELASQGLPETFLRKTLLYALQANDGLDVEAIAHTLEASPVLKEAFMSTAEKLIAQGEIRGKAEGKTRGVWIGKVQLLEEMLGIDPSSEDVLAQSTLEELEARFLELQQLYRTQFKKDS